MSLLKLMLKCPKLKINVPICSSGKTQVTLEASLNRCGSRNFLFVGRGGVQTLVCGKLLLPPTSHRCTLFLGPLLCIWILLVKDAPLEHPPLVIVQISSMSRSWCKCMSASPDNRSSEIWVDSSQAREGQKQLHFLTSVELSLVAKCNVHFLKKISQWKSVKYQSQTSARSDRGLQTPWTLPLDPQLLKRTMIKKITCWQNIIMLNFNPIFFVAKVLFEWSFSRKSSEYPEYL